MANQPNKAATQAQKQLPPSRLLQFRMTTLQPGWRPAIGWPVSTCMARLRNSGRVSRGAWHGLASPWGG